MLQTVSLAHAQKSNLCVLHVERLIRKLAAVNRCVLHRGNLSALNEHALHDATDLTSVVTDFQAIAFESLAKLDEVFASLRSDVGKQLEDQDVIAAVKVESELREGAGFRVVDGVLQRVGCLLLVHNSVGVVEVAVVLQSVLQELLSTADVLTIVQED